MWMAGAIGQTLQHYLWGAASIHKRPGLVGGPQPSVGSLLGITSSLALAPYLPCSLLTIAHFPVLCAHREKVSRPAQAGIPACCTAVTQDCGHLLFTYLGTPPLPSHLCSVEMALPWLSGSPFLIFPTPNPKFFSRCLSFSSLFT